MTFNLFACSAYTGKFNLLLQLIYTVKVTQRKYANWPLADGFPLKWPIMIQELQDTKLSIFMSALTREPPAALGFDQPVEVKIFRIHK